MSKADSNAVASRGKTQKPNKPNPNFPLFPHAARVWAKKIGGKPHYFGKWDDPDGALAKYNVQKEALHAGRKPREDAEGYPVKMLCNQFLHAKESLVNSGELTRRSWEDYEAACGLVIERFGKSRLVSDLDPEDFAALPEAMVGKGWGSVEPGTGR